MEFKVGDLIEAISLNGLSKFQGIIRYIGILKVKNRNFGELDSIWSSWEQEFDGKLKPNSEGGTLSYCEKAEVRLIRRLTFDLSELAKMENEKWPELQKCIKEYVEWCQLPEEQKYHLSEKQKVQDNYYPRYGKIWTIKKVREITGFGLLDAKQLVEIFEKRECMTKEDDKLLVKAGFYKIEDDSKREGYRLIELE